MGEMRTGRRRGLLAVQIIGLLVLALVGASLFHLARDRGQRTTEAAYATPAPTYTATSDSSPTAVFLGDSTTQGWGASEESVRWTTLVAGELDWTEVNLGRGGTGYVSTAGFEGCGLQFCPNVEAMVADAVAEQPDVVVVAGGQNDLVEYADDPDPVDAAIAATFTELRRQLPDARIVAVGPSTTTTPGPEVNGVDDAVRAAAASVDAEYVSLLDPDVLGPEDVDDDGVHPNDAGHRAIAERVLATVQ